jgi:hypothetical protein
VAHGQPAESELGAAYSSSWRDRRRFDCDGKAHHFPTEEAAGDFLLEDEFRSWEQYETEDFSGSGLSINQVRANWTVPGHQDRIVAVGDDSFRKNRPRHGVAYAEPDARTLAALVALRVHFDATTAETGALSVIPGSHRDGVLTAQQIEEIPLDRYVPCEAKPGDVLAMRPLLLHRSSPSRGDGQRRVLHVVYAAGDPDDGIRWRTAVYQGDAAAARERC